MKNEKKETNEGEKHTSMTTKEVKNLKAHHVVEENANRKRKREPITTSEIKN